jgi:hypothetical protein
MQNGRSVCSGQRIHPAPGGEDESQDIVTIDVERRGIAPPGKIQQLARSLL